MDSSDFGCVLNMRADTRAVVEYVSKHTDGGVYDLATEWLFTPSAMFYAQTEFPGLSLAPYNKAIVKDIGAMYYYVHPEHVATLEPEYRVVERFNGRVLLKRGH